MMTNIDLEKQTNKFSFEWSEDEFDNEEKSGLLQEYHRQHKIAYQNNKRPTVNTRQ